MSQWGRPQAPLGVRGHGYGCAVKTGWWNWDGWPRADEWAAWWTFATFVVATVAAVIALRQFAAYIAEREERARPYLVVDFVFQSRLLFVAVRNVSGALAANVTMTASPMLKSTSAGRDDVIAGILDGRQVIPQIAPGRAIQWFVDQAPDLYANSDLPHRVVVTVAYDDPSIRAGGWPLARHRPRHYVDTFVLDLDQYGEASMEQDFENRNWNIATRNEHRLERLMQAAQRMANQLDRLGDAQVKRDADRVSERPDAGQAIRRARRRGLRP